MYRASPPPSVTAVAQLGVGPILGMASVLSRSDCNHGLMAAPMASMTIRNLDERLKARLRVRPAKNGGSMEDEARDIVQPLRALQLGRAW